jgi:hypothetical protein
MRRCSRLILGLTPALIAIFVVGWAVITSPAEAQEGGGSELTISVSEREKSTLTGDVFTFTSEITNESSERTPALIANLAFVAVDGDTYVDPEDWSPERTIHIAPIARDSSLTLTWTVKTVLQGDVAVYVTVLPAPPDLSSESVLAVSPAVQVHVVEDRKLNPGGVLPTVLAVPALLAAGFVGLRVARRRA